MNPSLGQLVRDLRRAAGLTQEELAARAGLSMRAISDLERGVNHTPRPTTIQLLVAALGLSDCEREHFDAVARAHALNSSNAATSASLAAREPVGPSVATGADALIPLIGRAGELATLEQHLAGHTPVGHRRRTWHGKNSTPARGRGTRPQTPTERTPGNRAVAWRRRLTGPNCGRPATCAPGSLARSPEA